MRYVTAFLFALLAAAPLAAQDVGATYRLKFRDVRVDSVKGGSVFYTVLLSEATPSTVGRSYKMNATTFAADYALKAPAPPPPDTLPTDTLPPADTVPPAPVPPLMVYYGGNNQSGNPGATLDQSISIRLTDSLGVGIDGDTILWQITSGGGSLNKSFSVTATEVGRTGWAGARWTLGASGAQSATATHKKTGQAMTFNATLIGAPPPPPPPTDTTPPAPVDTTITVIAQSDWNGTTMGPFSNSALAAGATCNFNGVAGQCSAHSWLINGRYVIRYERLVPISAVQSVDANRSFESPDLMVQHGEYIYSAATYRFRSISAEQRQRIDSAYTYWMGTTWKDSTGNNTVAVTSTAQHEDALQKIKYFARQLGVNGGGLNHAVLAFDHRILRFTPAVKYDPLTKTCATTGTPVYNIVQIPAGQFLDRDHRIAILIKRSSGPMMPDGEFTVWVNGVQYGPYPNICTNRDSIIKGFGRVSIGQQYQFRGIYSALREIDDAVVGKKAN